jgi:hypothetical protein
VEVLRTPTPETPSPQQVNSVCLKMIMNKTVYREICLQGVTLAHFLRNQTNVLKMKKKGQDHQTALINLKLKNHLIFEWIVREYMRNRMM